MKIFKILITCFAIIAAQSILFAQTKNNLNFENINLENENLPKGWFKWGDFKSISGEKLADGTNVGKVVSDNDGTFGCITYALPINYAGDTIMLSGRIKHENVKGYVGLLMRIHGENASQVLGFANMGNLKINGTKDWAEYSIKLPLPTAANHIYVGGILSGTGTAWFNDFKISIDGMDIETLKETPKIYLKDFNKDILTAAIRKSSVAIDLSNDINLASSLDPLIKELANKKVVAIGESTHGTSEFYKLRDIISRKLIQDHGFNMVVLENPYDDIEMLNHNLLQRPLDTLIKKHLFSIYQTEEVKSFLEWYTDNRTEYGIQFKGCDDSFYNFYEVLEENTSEIKDKSLEKLMKKLKTNISKSATKNSKNESHYSIAIYDNILSIESYLKSQNKLKEPIKDILYNVKNTYINYLNIKNKNHFQSRDEIMADRISYLAKNKNNKIIVWAHNTHISKEVLYDNETGIMGRNLKKEFGIQYHSIGLSTLKGSYSYINERFINGDHIYNDKLESAAILATEKSFWENAFALNGEAYYLNMSLLNKELKTDVIIGPTKFIGYNKENDEAIIEVQLLKHFDSMIFIKNTTATTPLFD